MDKTTFAEVPIGTEFKASLDATAWYVKTDIGRALYRKAGEECEPDFSPGETVYVARGTVLVSDRYRDQH